MGTVRVGERRVGSGTTLVRPVSLSFYFMTGVFSGEALYIGAFQNVYRSCCKQCLELPFNLSGFKGAVLLFSHGSYNNLLVHKREVCGYSGE